MPKPAHFRIGISGWTYAPWRGVFYPDDLTQKQELHYASRQVNSIEINGTFYSLQKPASFQEWYEQTPDDFLFAVKAPQFITHRRRLKEVQQPLANFLASGLLGLKQKLGPVLWQLPPNLKFDAAKMKAFFELLPHDTASAARLAKKHDARLKDRAMTTIDENRPLRHAIEVRHESFATAEFIDVLRACNIALVNADTAGKWPHGEDVTADFVYIRLHGDEELYASGYTPRALDRWHKRLLSWSKGTQPSDAKRWSKKNPRKASHRDVYVYFDNDVKVKSPIDAMSLAHRIGDVAHGEARIGASLPSTPKLSKKVLAGRVRSHWPVGKEFVRKKRDA